MSKQHYINNPDFLQAIKDYRLAVHEAEESGEPKPKLPDYIGECILKIANHLSHKPNFINYTYRDDMISDGIENCLMYFHNFDPNKSSNPFAYFTQIIYYAFIRRIQKEKKQTLIKSKIIVEMPYDLYDLQQHDEEGTTVQSYIEHMQHANVYNDAIAKDETRKAKAKAKRAATLEELIDDVVDVIETV